MAHTRSSAKPQRTVSQTQELHLTGFRCPCFHTIFLALLLNYEGVASCSSRFSWRLSRMCLGPERHPLQGSFVETLAHCDECCRGGCEASPRA